MNAEPADWFGTDEPPLPSVPPNGLAELEAEAEAHDPRGTSSRWTLATSDERERIVRDADAWRSGLPASIDRAGFATEAEYLAAVLPSEDVRRLYLTPDELADIHAANADVAVPSRKPLAFRTARELAEMVSEVVAWAAVFLAFGAVTELDGKPKAAGKTTYILELVRAILDGLPFLGRPTTATPVVMLTEQAPVSLRESLSRSGLTERDDFHLLTWSEAAGTPWADVVAAAAARARHVGARVLVVDTLPQFAGLRGDSENDSGSAFEAIEPLQLLAAEGFAVLVARHDRKGGGEVGESARGSGAFTGAVDTVLSLSRDSHDLRPTMRRLYCLSRFSDTPPELMLELVDGRYVVLGSIESVRASALADAVLAILPDEPETVLPTDLADVLGKDETTIKLALNGLHREDPPRVSRTGAGRKGDPYRWSRPLRDAGFLSGAHPTGVGTIRKETPSPPGPLVVTDYPASAWDLGESTA